MSKSYAKYIRIGNCSGSNTEYYRARRRLFRKKYAENISKAFQKAETWDENIADYATTIDDVYVHPEKQKKFINTWDEPTDGSWKMTKKDIKRKERCGGYLPKVYVVKSKNRIKK